jgi:hypothetical protein
MEGASVKVDTEENLEPASFPESEIRIEKRGLRRMIVGAPPVTAAQIVAAIAAEREDRTVNALPGSR